MNSDGNLFLKGRIKRIIVLHEGFKVSPLDIENVLLDSGLVNNCCVIGIKDMENGYGSIPIANVVLNSSVYDDKEKVIKKLMKICEGRISS